MFTYKNNGWSKEFIISTYNLPKDTKDIVLQELVKDLSDTLYNCTNCIDCTLCRECSSCTNCNLCTYCYNCKNCRQCDKCFLCVDKEKIKNKAFIKGEECLY